MLLLHGFRGTVRRFSRGIAMSASRQEDVEYERAVTALNGLQTNAQVLEQIRKAGNKVPFSEMPRMYQYLERTGLKVEDLNQLNAIHVSGTKGKGSVCAMCESILRSHGLKTGFYSSPHLLEVRERIRINGRPLSKSDFVSHFWDCYNQLASTKEQYDGAMPAYFRFLTVMAFHVFLKEKVDVAVVEVGIGGTFDSTNIIPCPVVCAVTSLGYDHIDILGDTLPKIAWHKGGISKPGRPVFTVPQLEEPLSTVADRARELKAQPLCVAPQLLEYPGNKPVLGLMGQHQLLNASLAVQVCRKWLQERGRWTTTLNSVARSEKTLYEVSVADPFPLPPEFLAGLQNCRWAGRNQSIRRQGITYYLDGAHTPQSVKACAEWFKVAARAEAESIKGTVVRVLLFNMTGRRKPKALMQHLLDCRVDYAVFCPNIADINTSNSVDQMNLMVTQDGQCLRSKTNEQAWIELCAEYTTPLSDPTAESHVVKLTTEKGPESNGDKAQKTMVFNCITHTLHWVASERDPTLPHSASDPSPPPSPPPHRLTSADHVQLLVTGSLHLVGAFMNVLGFTVDDV